MNYYSYSLEQQQQQPQQPQSSYYQLASEDYDLKIRQQPRDALLAQEGKEKQRKPVDPPPIIEVSVRSDADPIKQFLQSPYLFMTCSLVPGDEGYSGAPATDEKGLCGTMVSSLHKLKDINNTDGGFFVFGDVSVKRTGEHKLLFSLFELKKSDFTVQFLKSILSDTFTVHPQKEYPGLEESTSLSRAFADQGVRLRLRKEARALGGGSGRKRSYPYQSQQTAQAGPSRPPAVTRAPSVYDASPLSHAQSAYSSDYAESSDSKRQRADTLGQYSGYPPQGQLLPSQASTPSLGSVPSNYPSQSSPLARLPTQQSVASQMSNIQSGYPRYYSQAPTSAPGVSSDYNYRSAGYQRMEPTESAQQPASLGYDRGASMGYGASGYQSASSAGHAGMNPNAAAFQSHGGAYGNMPDTSAGYSQYSPNPQHQYRGDSAYGSGTLGQQPFSPENQLPQQQQQQQQQHQMHYGDMSQGYSSSFDSQGRPTGYQPPSRGSWGQ